MRIVSLDGHKHVVKNKEMVHEQSQTDQTPRTQFVKHGLRSHMQAPTQAQARTTVNTRVPIVDPVGEEPNRVLSSSIQPDHSVYHVVGPSIIQYEWTGSSQSDVSQQQITDSRPHFLHICLHLPIPLQPGTYTFSPFLPTPADGSSVQQSLLYREHDKTHRASALKGWSAAEDSRDAVHYFATRDHHGYPHTQTSAKYSQLLSQTHHSEDCVKQQLRVRGIRDNGSITDRARSVQHINKTYEDSQLAYADIGDGYYFRKLHSDQADQQSAVDKRHIATQSPYSPLHKPTSDPNITFDSMATRDGWRKTSANAGTDHEVPESRHTYPNGRVRVCSQVKVKVKKVVNEILPSASPRMTQVE